MRLPFILLVCGLNTLIFLKLDVKSRRMAGAGYEPAACGFKGMTSCFFNLLNLF
jgi:hypothetical protein